MFATAMGETKDISLQNQHQIHRYANRAISAFHMKYNEYAELVNLLLSVLIYTVFCSYLKVATSRYFESVLRRPKLQFKCWET